MYVLKPKKSMPALYGGFECLSTAVDFSLPEVLEDNASHLFIVTCEALENITTSYTKPTDDVLATLLYAVLLPPTYAEKFSVLA